MVNGAGLAMATMDIIALHGTCPALHSERGIFNCALGIKNLDTWILNLNPAPLTLHLDS